MKVTISPGPVKGSVSAIPSKSHLHRLLICAALADQSTLLRCLPAEAEDIKATIGCLSALGARFESREDGILVTPLNRARLPCQADFDCMESGSTLRFMLPVVSALGISGKFHMSGRLPERPLSPLDEELSRHGVRLWRPVSDVLCCEGQLRPAHLTLPGNVSSQYISGLLMALPLLRGDSALRVEKPVESADYITMTLQALTVFGQPPEMDGGDYIIRGGGVFISPGEADVDGDWSNAAFWLCAGAMPGGEILHRGLSEKSTQGDREICDILARVGAKVSREPDGLRVLEGTRRGVEIDARAIPDLVPVLCAVAAVAGGITVIKNATRLRLKESDRIAATAGTLTALGAKITEKSDGLEIEGVSRLSGGTVDCWGDHRIAMMAAVASAACANPVTITGAQAVRKSYPRFWEELSAMGKEVTTDE